MSTISKEKINFLKTCMTGYIADAYVQLGLAKDILNYTVSSGKCRPFKLEDSFVGQAVTVRFAPMLPGQASGSMFDVFADAPAESAVVMAGIQGALCYIGDVLANYAANQEMAAIVAEGYVRDTKGCIQAGIPIFSQGGTTAIKGKELYGVAEVNKPIKFYDIMINPGDILMGDCDGIIRIPLELFDDVYAELNKIIECERKYEKAFKEGGPNLLNNLKKVSSGSH